MVTDDGNNIKSVWTWKVIDEPDGKKETSGKQQTAIDEKAENTTKGIIFQTLPQDMLMQVAQYTTAKEEWNSIKVKHIGADLVQKVRLQTLRNELETLKMKPNESENEFARKLSSIQAKFKSLGGTLKVKVLVRKLLNSVPKNALLSTWTGEFNPNRSIHTIRTLSTGPPVKRLTVLDRATSWQ
nr:zinc finger, CCHC-type [Tanacetum cinerariifolium]